MVDSITLAETDSVYLGNPAAAFTMDANGNYFVPDRGNNYVLQFTPAGSLVRRYGKQGSGPGEFRGLGNAAMVVGGQLWQDDYALRRISVYDTSGGHIKDIPYEGSLASLKTADRGVWAGLAHPGGEQVVTWFDPGLEQDSLKPMMIAPPQAYDEFRVLRFWNNTTVVAAADTLIVAFGGVEYVVRYDIEGVPIDTAWVPVCRRQGSPREALEAGFRAMARSTEERARVDEAQTRISGLLGLWRLSDQQLLIWYQDPRRDPGGVYLSRAYLSVLSPDLQQACVDAELSGASSERAILAVHNDQVHLLDQEVIPAGDGTSVRTVVRRYEIDTSRCRWLPTAETVPGARVR